MDQCRDRSWPFHRIGQPNVERELSRLANRPDHQKKSDECYQGAFFGSEYGDRIKNGLEVQSCEKVFARADIGVTNSVAKQ